MATVQPTADQLQAITTTGCSVTVSAAAGSGKTSVLAQRCAYLVCDAPPAARCAVDEMVVLTFTEAAAAEMRGRVRQAIAERVAAAPQDDRLRRQLLLLDDAHVTTIHAFCRWFIGQHFVAADIDPACAILEPEEALTILHDAAHQAIRARLTEDDSAMRDLLLNYMHGDDVALAEELVRLYEFVGSLDDGAGWCRRSLEACGATPDELVDREARTFDRELERQILGLDALNACLTGGIEGGRAIARRFATYRDSLQGCRDELRRDPTRFEDLVRTAENFTWSRFTYDAEDGSDDDRLGRELAQQVKKTWHGKRLSRFALFTLAQRSAGLRAIEPHVEALFGLLETLTASYRDSKRRRAVVDFNDLEHLAHDLLRGPDGGPSDIARSMHARFSHILVDEYQDVSPLQEAILGLLSRESSADHANNLFCVGDVKQSIYRFRHADPTVFAHRTARDACDDHTLVNLSANFRSRPMILDAVNAIFERILVRALGEVDYDDAARLQAGREFDHDGHPVEVHLLPPVKDDHTDDNIECQARVIGQRIEELVASGAHDYGDMVILLRAATGRAEQMAAVLQRMGIPTAADTASGFFSAMEISDVLSLLRVLDNRRQDIALAATMRSGVTGSAFDDAELAAIRATAPSAPFHAAVLGYADAPKTDDPACDPAKVHAFLERLSRYRRWIERTPLSAALWRIYADSGCLGTAAARPGGAGRRANLLALQRRAASFGSGDGRGGLHAFLQFVEHMQDRKQDLGLANPATPAPRIVRIMTVHNSKGLQFPVVFVANLEKPFNLSDSRQTVVYDRQEGLGLPIFDARRLARYPSLLLTRATEALRRGETAEEMRILYVALTRAQDRLILVGSADDDKLRKIRRLWSGHDGPLPEMALLGAQSHLDWILPAIAAQNLGDVVWHDDHGPRTGDDAPLFNMIQAPPMRLVNALQDGEADDARAPGVAELGPLPTGEAVDRTSPAVMAVFERLAFRYPWPDAAAVPAVASVTSLAKGGQADGGGRPAARTAPDATWERPRFVNPDAPPSAADIGTATHALLEHLDYDRAGELAAQRDALVAHGLLESRVAGAIDLEALAWFLATPLGQDMAAAGEALRREVRVLTRRPAADIMPDGHTAPGDYTLVRGMVDAIVPRDGACDIIDFKTDRIGQADLAGRVAVYRPQLHYYAMAIEDIWKIQVPRAALVFLEARHIEWLDLGASFEQLQLWE